MRTLVLTLIAVAVLGAAFLVNRPGRDTRGLPPPVGPAAEEPGDAGPPPPPPERLALEPTSSARPEDAGSALTGRALLADGSPFALGELALLGPQGAFEELVLDAEGRFALATLAPGEHRFVTHGNAGAEGLRAEPAVHQLVPSAADGPVHVELRILRPERELEVIVVRPPDRAGPVRVTLASPGFFIREVVLGPDEDRARFGYSDAELSDELVLQARSELGDSSGVRRLPADDVPLQVRLELLRGAAVDLRVWTDDGDPASGRQVVLVPHDGIAALTSGPGKETDELGRVSFEDLTPGITDVRVARPGGGFIIVETFEVLPGARLPLEVSLPPDLPLAVSGILLDERGGPLEGGRIVIVPEGVSSFYAGDVRTGSGGTFELYAPRSTAVYLNANLDPGGDVFEPRELRVEHGTRDVVFQRVAEARVYSFRVDAIDGANGTALGDVVATFDRGGGTERWSNSYSARREFEVSVLPDTRMRIAVPGYHVFELALLAKLEAAADPGVLRVSLTPGLRHVLYVYDASSEAALEGVTLAGPEGRTFTTDASGRVLLVAEKWGVFTLSKEGFEDQPWDPFEAIPFDFGAVYLEPVFEEGH